MFKLFKTWTKKDYLIILTILILIIGQVLLELKIPDYMSEITRLVETPGSLISEILASGGKMLLCAFGSILLAGFGGLLSSYTSASLSMKIRKKLFLKVESFNMEEIRKFSVPSLITRTTNDITQVQMFVSMGLQLIFRSPIMAVLAIIKILNKGIEWSIATSIAVVLLLTMITILIILVMPKFKKLQKVIDDVNTVARENLNGIRVIHAFNKEEYEIDKFNDKNENLTSIQMFADKALSIMGSFMFLVMHILTLSIYLIGARLIDQAVILEKIDIFANMVVFTSYSMQVIMSFMMLTAIFILAPRASVSAGRINEVLDTEIKIKNGSKKLKKCSGEIEFKNVSFKYPDGQDYVIKDISFKINPGETIAIIGSTGSGKTTLINLIPRFYDASKGSVLIDGVDVKEFDQASLNESISYVPQKAVMFNASVFDNVNYGAKGKKKIEVRNALVNACADDFVLKLENGVNSMISKNNLSGGQKGRISIARALRKNANILIFDDSFSALDYKTDSRVRKNIKKNYKGATKIIVASRIGTIMDADAIIVLDKGKCVGIGRHEELLKNCPVYKEIAVSQLSESELKL